MGREGCTRHVWTCLFESRFQKSDMRERTAASVVGGGFTCRQQNNTNEICIAPKHGDRDTQMLSREVRQGKHG